MLGGNLDFDGGTYGAFDGRLELGGLTESGTININNDGSFIFSQAVSRGNLSAAATFVVGGGEGGAIGINAKNLSLTSGSFLFAAILNNSEFANVQAGDVVINLTEDFVLDDSLITNSVLSGAGNTGNIKVDAHNITFNNGGTIASVNVGEGNPGSITLTARVDITFDGIGSNGFSGISNSLGEGGGGNIGEINVTAQNFNLTNGANIFSLSETNNDSGDINLNVADTIRIDGFGVATLEDGTQSEANSGISSGIIDGNGNSGNININNQNLTLNHLNR